MKENKWIILAALLLTVLVFVAIFWDNLILRIAPKAVLTSALTKVFTQLEERFQNDPLLILAKNIDPEGKYTANIKTETENRLLGRVSYDMIVQTDANRHCLSAEGTAATAQTAMDLSLYMDSDFMAVSSDTLVEGTFYGIGYESFPDDIRSIPLLNFMVSDHLLSQWDASVKNIQAQMKKDYFLPRIPEVGAEEIKALLLGILAAPCEIEQISLLLNETTVTCKKLDYKVRGAEVENFLSKLFSKEYEDNASITASFYLYEKALIKISIACGTENDLIQCSLDLGLNPSEKPLTLQGTRKAADSTDHFTATVSTSQGENLYTEQLAVQFTSNDAVKHFSLQFKWEPVSGAMQLNINNTPEAIPLTFLEIEDGFYIITNDFNKLLNAISEEKGASIIGQRSSCIMTVKKGSEIIKPEYKNLNQWSLDDFTNLVSGIGSLIGLRLGN